MSQEPVIKIRPQGKTLDAAGLLLLLFGGLLFASREALWEAGEDGVPVFQGAFFAVYLTLSLLAALLCLVEVSLPQRARRIVSWALMVLLPAGVFVAVDLINETRVAAFPFRRLLANYLCALLPFLLAFALTRRAWAALLLGGGGCLVFGIVNAFVVRYRGQPLLPWDLSATATAIQVAGGYRFALTRPMLLALSAWVCGLLLAAKLGTVRKAELPRPARAGQRAAALALGAGLAVALFPAPLLSALGISVYAWDQRTSTEINGVLAGFAANVRLLMVEKPEGYSPQRAEALAEWARGIEDPAPLGEPGEAPTVIAVMNESFTDLAALEGVEFTPDALPFFHRLRDSGQVIWGTAYSSVFGGNTCNSEYEFLTGNTMAFLPSGSKPYQQYLDGPQASLARTLKAQGYACAAIHPGSRVSWQRDTAYPALGFDRFISFQDFTVEKENVHGLTADRSTYRQIIQLYEERDPAVPQFYFDVTIQNHGGYLDETVDTTVRVAGQEGRYPEAEQYASLLRLSDRDLEELVGYFSAQEDPVVILFFGDHQPSLGPEFTALLTGSEDPEFPQVMEEYRVPYLIWANYPLEAQEISPVSLNQLGGLLLRAAGLEGTGYTRYLGFLGERLPVITAIGGIDREGTLYQSGQDAPYGQEGGEGAKPYRGLDGQPASYRELLNEYAILQYNNAFDESGKVTGFFEPPAAGEDGNKEASP